MRVKRLTQTIAAALQGDQGVRNLFANGEQGVWFDPSDMASMFQDSAGTLPVTAVEQPVGLILDKRFGLARGAERLTDTGFDNASAWTLQPTAPATVTISGSQLTLVSPAGESVNAYMPARVTSGKWYEVTLDVASYTGSAGVYFSGPGTTAIPAGAGTKTFRVLADGADVGIKRITACNIVVNSMSVREIPGNHASQATAAARPVLSARKNLALASENFADAVWTKTNCTVANAGNGYWRITDDATNATHNVAASNSIALAVGAVATISAKVKNETLDRFRLSFNNSAMWGGVSPNASFNLTAGTVSNANGGVGTMTNLGNGEWLLQVACPAVTTAGSTGANLLLLSASGIGTYAGGGGTFLVAFVQVETGTTATRYQRVTTATDYDSAGFPHYLKFDGVDDFLTNTTAFANPPGSVIQALAYDALGTAQNSFGAIGNDGGLGLAKNSGNNLQIRWGTGAGLGSLSLPTTIAQGVVCILSGTSSGTNMAVQRDLGAPTTAAGTNVARAVAGFTLGAWTSGGTERMTGRIYMHVHIARVLSATELNTLRRHMANKSGVIL